MKYTQEEIIEKFKEILGEEYDYSKVEYKNTNIPVCIICPKHGEFWKTPGSIIYGKQKCQECSKEERLKKEKEKFLLAAKKIYGDKYDYSKVDYVNNSTKVTIVCPIHGDFQVTPSRHIHQKCGCQKCSYRLYTTKEWIDVANQIHKNKYDYSLIDEITTLKKKYPIRCKKCGNVFEMAWGNHIDLKQGCKYCNHRSYAYTTEDFIKKAKQVHGDKYDYSLVKYKNKKEKVKIICPIHGVFEQCPEKHINRKQGCPLCAKNKKVTMKDFSERAHFSHGTKYDYSKVQYEKIDDKVCIICPKHGEFWQSARSHINGCGCPMCREEGNMKEMELFNYIKENINEEVVCQYKEKWLDGQTLDIFIPKYNIAVEYQGIQHFKPIKYFGGKKKYEYTVMMDRRKFDKCKNNKVKLFYFTFEKNIPDKYFSDIYRNKELLLEEINRYANK